ncbi:MAG: DEAD/DEAH box helicase family protein, partial [Bacteroidales bacterium]|nr:DEAD/DEAH box helicase family protein [Bacteroidales bacterium]
MAKFQLGASVLRHDSSQRGVIIDVAPARRGRQIYRVNWDGKITDELEEDLVQDYNVSDPFERCSNGIFGTYSEYSKKNTSFKIKSSNNSTISSLKASKTLFRAYQFKPLLKFLNSPSRRLLVADEVGLGKTIEAGHIMLELKARRELQNVLIVCPKSLQEKWKMELQEKFGLAFRIYDRPKELLEDLQYRNGQVRAIVNYEKIRFKKNDTKKAEQTGEKDNLISYLTDSG